MSTKKKKLKEQQVRVSYHSARAAQVDLALIQRRRKSLGNCHGVIGTSTLVRWILREKWERRGTQKKKWKFSFTVSAPKKCTALSKFSRSLFLRTNSFLQIQWGKTAEIPDPIDCDSGWGKLKVWSLGVWIEKKGVYWLKNQKTDLKIKKTKTK